MSFKPIPKSATTSVATASQLLDLVAQEGYNLCIKHFKDAGMSWADMVINKQIMEKEAVAGCWKSDGKGAVKEDGEQDDEDYEEGEPETVVGAPATTHVQTNVSPSTSKRNRIDSDAEDKTSQVSKRQKKMAVLLENNNPPKYFALSEAAAAKRKEYTHPFGPIEGVYFAETPGYPYNPPALAYTATVHSDKDLVDDNGEASSTPKAATKTTTKCSALS
ncbi:uncharacterized protein RAG0_04126 [Rhynchosporium agropyri]|uniref:Uncharacterized protein n=1 Tax=Rhynchosporium agropyri TaxID=914238 RepID=A0A1E1K7M8_9HELO|nr:uncharacterized protein RAG0_04126 [Rhynchosporium agropyri]